MKQKPPKKGIKKRVLDDEFLEMLEGNAGNISQTCKAANRGRSWFYRRIKKSATFRQAVEEIHESLIDRAESALVQKIDDGELGAICFLLKCKGKSRGWVESPRIPGKQKPDPEAVRIIDGFLKGDLTPVEACLEFERSGLPVPETLMVLLKQAEPEIDEAGEPMGEDFFKELDAKYYAKLAAIDREQTGWVPERQAEVSEIKKELADLDSFSDENLENERDKK